MYLSVPFVGHTQCSHCYRYGDIFKVPQFLDFYLQVFELVYLIVFFYWYIIISIRRYDFFYTLGSLFIS